MSDYEHGKMEISGQEHAFAGFVSMLIWSSAIIIAVLIFLALVAT